LEAWEKVFVGYEFVADVHNVQNCIGCHGGVADVEDMQAAHEGVVRDPLAHSESSNSCRVCHTESGRTVETSLHRNLAGFRTALEARGADMSDPAMEAACENHCSACHTTCGQCHISRPTYHDGGLLKEHEVKTIASMKDTCLACHGARVANEYQGKNEGVEGSVHWTEEGMACFECHQVTDYHGDGTEYAHRYDGEPSVDCLDCHPEASPEASDIEEHVLHGDKVACQVCHVSGSYKSCYNCHVGLDDQGEPFFKSGESQMTLKIGRNQLQSEERPWAYVLVRHVPVVKDTFAFYDGYELPKFDNVPTWKYATPHNIRRVTAQNQSCDGCHGNEALFLTADDVAHTERAANADVMVDAVPPLPPHPGLERYDTPGACVECHPQAVEGDWELLSDNVHAPDHVVEPEGEVIRCEDCHAPEGNFDWIDAGYTAQEASQFIWSDYPTTTAAGYGSEPPWVAILASALAVGIALNFVTMIALVRRRSR
jgi:thiosulfate/3-mercaptopyruvate sulfurtransferase